MHASPTPSPNVPKHENFRAILGRRFSQRQFSYFAIVVLGCFLGEHSGAHPTAQAEPAARPNIIFIFSDDHGAQAISAYGSNRNKTPNIDRIANEGIRFDRCYVTNSICAPSRAVILTGKHTHMIGHTTNERIFDTRLLTFPPLMQQAGYQTALIGKWHQRTEPRGFDYWDTLNNQGTYYNPDMIQNGKRRELTGYTTDIITDLSLEWLKEQRKADKPFMLMVQHKASHRMWDPDLDDINKYDDVTIPEPPTLFDDWANRSSAWSYAEMSLDRMGPADLHLETPKYQLNDEQKKIWEQRYGPENEAFFAAKLSGAALWKWRYQRFAKDYIRCIDSLDRNIGRILDYLDESGLAENTIVVYSSDQGWFLGEHGWFDKRWMYEESFRMPLVARWPAATPPGTVNTNLVQNLDFAPTFLDLAGATIPDDMQGRSLVPALKTGTMPQPRDAIYYHFYEDLGAHKTPRHYGVRTDRYKLMHFYKLDEWEMFDLEKDPDELVSVYDDPEYAAIRDELKQKLAELQRQYEVTEAADAEYDEFHKRLESRWKFLQLLGTMPNRWNIEVETLHTDDFPEFSRAHLAYRIGKEPVKAFVYVPKNRTGPLPAVVLVHPGAAELRSYERGKRYFAETPRVGDTSFAVELCKRGYVVMCYDRHGYESRKADNDAGQGEFPSLRSPGEDAAYSAEACKRLMDGSSLLAQELSEMWFATDCLSRRPDVHAKRIGVLGVGEGASLAAMIGFVYEEIAATIAIGGLREFDAAAGHKGEETVSPLCSLMTIPKIHTWGGMGDVVAGIYPRPFLSLGNIAESSAVRNIPQQRYGDYGFSDRIVFEEKRVDVADGLSSGAREAAMRWLGKTLQEPGTRQ
ncbi:MAG: sulfatase/phosphatase domain-containing protein [Phycisphaerae bacterium]